MNVDEFVGQESSATCNSWLDFGARWYGHDPNARILNPIITIAVYTHSNFTNFADNSRSCQPILFWGGTCLTAETFDSDADADDKPDPGIFDEIFTIAA